MNDSTLKLIIKMFKKAVETYFQMEKEYIFHRSPLNILEIVMKRVQDFDESISAPC